MDAWDLLFIGGCTFMVTAAFLMDRNAGLFVLGASVAWVSVKIGARPPRRRRKGRE